MSQMELPDQVSPPHGAGAPWPHSDAASALSAFVEQGPLGVAVIDTELRFRLVSPGLAALHGQEATQSIGRRVIEVLPAPYSDQVTRRIRAVLASGAPIVDAGSWDRITDSHSERTFTSSYYRLDDSFGSPLGVVMLVTETTELRTALGAAKAAGAQLELLQKITDAFSESGTVADVTEAALKGAVRALDASAAVLMALGPDDELVPLASAGLEDPTLARLQEPAPLEAHLPHCDALRSRTIVLWGSRVERDLAYPDLARYSGDHQAWAFVPMVAREGGIGVVMFAWRLDRDFAESDVSLFAAVGRHCAVALEQIRILEAEREARRATEFLVEVTKFVVEGSDEGVYAMSAGNRILTFNRRFCEFMGLAETAIQVGADARSLLAHWLALAADPDALSQHLDACRERPFEQLAVEIALKDGGVIACVSAPIVDRHNDALGRVWYLRDETERRAQEAEQRAALEELRASHEHQAFLLQAAEIVSQGDGYGDTLQRLAAVAVPTLADLCLVDALTWDGRIVRMAAKHANPVLQPLVDELATKYAPDPAGAHPSIEVMQTGRVRWSATMSDDFLRKTSRDDQHYALLKRLGFTSYMTLPLVADNRILGSITLVSAGSGRRFAHQDVVLADDYTSCVAQVVAAAYRNDTARHAAHTLQASLLPEHVPEIPGLAIAVRYLPATLDNEVGGDFYDVIEGPSDVVTIVIGDVAGHDMQAAAVMGKIRTAVRVLANQATGPKHFIEMLRHGWDSLELERIATLLVTYANTQTGELRIVSAGHPPPLLVTPDHSEMLGVKPTTPLGAPRSAIDEWRGTLAEGDTLLLFTDGLIEDRHRSFSDGAAELVGTTRGPLGPEELCDQVLRTMVSDDPYHDDDIALVALARASRR